jgi:hypothetical protein
VCGALIVKPSFDTFFLWVEGTHFTSFPPNGKRGAKSRLTEYANPFRLCVFFLICLQRLFLLFMIFLLLCLLQLLSYCISYRTGRGVKRKNVLFDALISFPLEFVVKRTHHWGVG